MAEWKISEDGAGQRLDKFVRKVLPEVPLSAIFKLIRTKKVRVNGVRAEEKQLLVAGDVVTVRDQALDARPAASDKPRVPQKIRRTFTVLHEDAHILVCVKPPGLAIHPGSGITGATLVDEVRAYLPPVPDGEFKPAPAHRLDKETSGVVVVAKTRQAIVRLAEIFAGDETKKTYLALVQGVVQPSGVIDVKLAEHQQTAASKEQRGVNMQEALTRYRRLDATRDVSLVEVEIETGRTHQIRRHFVAIGHPLAGDDKHGDFPWNKHIRGEWGLKRMFLHAARLQLPHPHSGDRMTFRAPVPKDLTDVLDHLGLALPDKFKRADD